jgi:membrane associated rhomboid family serine protease
MAKLPLVAYILVAPVLMGIFLTVLLTLDMRGFDATMMAGAAIAGAIAAIPVAWLLARKLQSQR